MNGTFVQAIAEQVARPSVLLVGGEERLIMPDGWREQSRQPKPSPAPLVLASLTGLVEYLRANRDGLTLADLVCHVAGPSLVTVYDRLDGEEELFRRRAYVSASLERLGVESFPFNRYVDHEAAIVGLQVHFLPTAELTSVLSFLASIKESTVRETVDDGYAQEVTARAGVALVANVKVDNPVTLQPWRTFREVQQPASKFILRLRSGAAGEKPTVALFEADGGMWKLEAVKRIADWISDGLKLNAADVTVIS